MDRPESSPAYLKHCVDSFLEAMREADAMAHAGNVGSELADLLRFATDLVDIIGEGLEGLDGAWVSLAEVEILRGMLRSTCCLLGSRDALH